MTTRGSASDSSSSERRRHLYLVGCLVGNNEERRRSTASDWNRDVVDWILKVLCAKKLLYYHYFSLPGTDGEQRWDFEGNHFVSRTCNLIWMTVRSPLDLKHYITSYYKSFHVLFSKKTLNSWCLQLSSSPFSCLSPLLYSFVAIFVSLVTLDCQLLYGKKNTKQQQHAKLSDSIIRILYTIDTFLGTNRRRQYTRSIHKDSTKQTTAFGPKCHAVHGLHTIKFTQEWSIREVNPSNRCSMSSRRGSISLSYWHEKSRNSIPSSANTNLIIPSTTGQVIQKAHLEIRVEPHAR